MKLASRLTAFVIALTSVSALSVADAPPATALDLLGITCLGSQTTTYEPGLTFQERPTTFTVTGTLSSCSSPTNPQIVSGTFSSKGEGSFSCVTGSAVLTSVIKWNTGQSTTVQIGFNLNAKPNGTTVLVSLGQVADGLFRGGVYLAPKVLTSPNLLGCATPEGMLTASGPVSVTIGLPA